MRNLISLAGMITQYRESLWNGRISPTTNDVRITRQFNYVMKMDANCRAMERRRVLSRRSSSIDQAAS